MSGPRHLPTATILIALAAAACVEPSDAGSAWPCGQGDPSRPSYRMTDVAFDSPASLDGLLGLMYANYLYEFRVLMLLEVDLEAGRARVGSGTPREIDPASAEPFCTARWSEGFPAATAALEESAGRLRTASPLSRLELPVYSSLGPDRVDYVLPLRGVEVEMAPEGPMIGRPLAWPDEGLSLGGWTLGRCSGHGAERCRGDEDCADGRCEPSARLDAWITVADARSVVIEGIGEEDDDVTLCWLLSGLAGAEGTGLADCDAPEGEWLVRPEPLPGTGEPAFRIAASFAAGAMTIEE